MTKLLWLDDTRKPPDNGWQWVKTVEAAKAALAMGDIDHASLDHDLGYSAPTGYDLVKWMCATETWPVRSIVVHSWNPAGARNMRAMIDRYGPYDAPCLVKQATWFWSPDPAEEESMEARLWDNVATLESETSDQGTG